MAIIFDFDRTLAIIETYDVGKAALNTVWGGEARVKSIEDVLKEALQVVNWEPYFKSGGVYGREDLIMGGMGPKSYLVNEKIIQQLSLRAEDCIFLDDDRSNVSDIECKVGCEVVWVRGHGMSPVDIAGLKDWVKRWASKHSVTR